MRKKTTSEIICQNFKIAPQTIFQDYKCTYRSSVTFFGRLYVGQEHFLFIANMFGLVKKCTIDINLITKIQYQPHSNNIIIQESINNNSQAIQYIFGSFKNNKAYKLMMALWKGQKVQTQILIKEVDEQIQNYNKEEKIDNSQYLDEGSVQANFFDAQAVETQKQKLVEIQLPCSIEQFYDFFLSDKATVYNRRKHLELRNSRQINITEWKKSEQLKSEVRQITTIIKVNGVPFLKEAGMSQVWMLKRQQDHLYLKVVTQMSDVPYSSYFNCEQHITVFKDSDKKCRMVVYASVIFNKSTYMKSKILNRTFGDVTEEYAFWIKNVKPILEQLKKRQQNTINGSQSDKQKYNQIQYQKSIPLLQQKSSYQYGKIQAKKQLKQESIIAGYKIFKISNDKKIDIIFIMVFITMIFTVLQFLYTLLF